ncbi:ribokinase [Pseudolysinimonas sp.]|jgi:ribokinase|uniref:ribokinase n=1 Tax=Pseudolysinimonas sp. TaxID=2680009 RepID=UPI00378468F9
MEPHVNSATPRVAVLGGINHDTFLRVSALPQPGETVIGTGLLRALGGKAANQAIAVARSGVGAVLLGAVGDDADGARLVDSLAAASVDVGDLLRLEHVPTGRAMILVDDAGQNVIVVTPAANGQLTAAHVAGFDATIASATVLVVQGEITAATTIAAVLAAERHGVRTIVNLAPYGDLGAALPLADPLVLNEIEASQLLGRAVEGPGSTAVVAELSRVARSAVVTLGADGALVVDQTGTVRHHPAPAAATVVDTTGAGDAFVGVLAAAIACGLSLDVAVARAVQAATASIGVLGAGEYYPDFDLGLTDRREAIAG